MPEDCTASTVNFGYNDVLPGKKKRSPYAKLSLYPKYTKYGIMYTICMDAEFCVCFTSVTWRRLYHASMHMYNVIYQRTCGCTACWRTTLACFSQAHALSHAFLALVDWFAVWFSSTAVLKLSNCSTCHYIRSDIGPLGTKYVSLFAKCRYSRCRYTWRILCASKWRKVLGKKSMLL